MARKHSQGGPSEPPHDPTPQRQEASAFEDAPPQQDAAPPAGAGSDASRTEPSARAASEPEDELAAARAQIAELNQRWLRAAADLENFRRRAERSRAEVRAGAELSILQQLLPVLDNFERALEVDAEAAPEAFREGVELIAKLMSETLSRLGVSAIPALGQNFDPEVHEAVEHRADDSPAGTVIAEHQKGYRLGQRLLRPARVTVSRGSDAAAAAVVSDLAQSEE